MSQKDVVLICEPSQIHYDQIDKNLKDVKLVPYNSQELQYKGTHSLHPGQIFINVDDLDCYFLNNEDVDINIMREHVFVFLEFCRKLGVEVADFTISIKKKSFFSWANRFKAKTPKGSGDVNVESEDEKQLKKELHVNDTFQRIDNAKIITEEEWEEAKAYYASHSYLHTTECEFLLNARNPKNKNQVREHNVRLKISENLNSKTKVAAKVKSAASIIRVTNDYTQRKKTSRTVFMNYKIVFPKID